MRHRTLLTALIALFAAAALVATSTAWIGAGDSSDGNAAETGELVLAVGGAGDGKGVVSAPDGIRPGQVLQGLTAVRNEGTVPGQLFVRLNAPPAASRALLEHLRLRVVECASAADCSAPVERIAPGPVLDVARAALGEIAPGSRRVFRAELAWPSAQDRTELYGAPADFTLRWTARSLPGGED